MTKLGLPWDQPFESLQAKSGGPKFILAVGTIIEVETFPFFDHLVVPIHIPYVEDYFPDSWPYELCGCVKLGEDPKENLDYTVSKIAEIFGPGSNVPVSWNAKVTRWDYGGWGCVSAVSQPLEKNTGPEAYVELSKGCFFTFAQKYIFPATLAQEAAIASARVIFTPAQEHTHLCAQPVDSKIQQYSRRYTRQSVKTDLPQETMMMSADNRYIIFPHGGDIVTIFPFSPQYLDYHETNYEPHSYARWHLSLRLPIHYNTVPPYQKEKIVSQIVSGKNEVLALYKNLQSLNPA